MNTGLWIPGSGDSMKFTGFFNEQQTTRERNARMKEMHSLEELQEQVEQLTLVNTALWSLLKEKLQLTDQELQAHMQQPPAPAQGIDEPAIACPECHHDLPPHAHRCMYCGFILPLSGVPIAPAQQPGA